MVVLKSGGDDNNDECDDGDLMISLVTLAVGELVSVVVAAIMSEVATIMSKVKAVMVKGIWLEPAESPGGGSGDGRTTRMASSM